ncbi:MAG TPA: DUF2059 domain-containing protein [Thermoanaerobaculia bacterium]|nr:DUF2059 domain-containing protein [Thermoanaerobaculia bacterium]
MKRTLILCLILACAAPLAAWSQGAKPASSHRQATEELLRVMGVEKTSVDAAMTYFNVMVEQNEAMADYKDVMVKWVKNTLSWEKMGPRMTDLYMRTFTEAEIRELIAFYKTPVGQKTLEQMPILMQEGMKIGTDLAKEHQGELEEAIKARQKELSEKAVDEEAEADEDKPPASDV